MPESKSARTTALLLTILTVATAATVLGLVVHVIRRERDGEQARWREAMQQRLEAAARRVREAWQQREAAALQLRDLPPEEAFATVMRDGLADSAIYPANSQPGYPALVQGDAFAEPQMPAAFAGALASQRARIAAKDWDGAIETAWDFFSEHRDQKTLSGRNIALGADSMLLSALRGAQHAVPSWLIKRMKDELNDYRQSSVPAPQRRMLMEELAGAEAATAFPTYDAECMALNVLSGDTGRAPGNYPPPYWPVEVIRPDGSGVQLLFKPVHLHTILTADAADKEVIIAPPGGTTTLATMDLHPSLPGWKAATSVSEADRRSLVMPFALAGGAVTLLLGGLTFLTWRQVQRQVRRAQLQEDLAATVSHELRTPVASMRLLAESLLEEREPAADKTREYLELIAGENVRLSRLIENFLTLARLERRPRDANGSLSVSEIVKRVTAAAGPHEARLQFTGTLPEAAVRGEAAALETALLNLIDNACKYSPPESPVEWRVDIENGRAVFSVSDHGPGLTGKELARIWKPFERGNTDRPGCGLGLTIVKRIAEQSHGSVSVENVAGGGCRFRLCLPLASKSLT